MFSNVVVWQTYNSLFLLRLITKYIIEIDSEENLYSYFIPKENSIERISLMSLFVDNLYRTATTLPVESFSYGIHLEILNILISLLSIQMYAKESTMISAIYTIFMHRLEYVVCLYLIKLIKNEGQSF